MSKLTHDTAVPTTSGAIALMNLHVQIDSLELQAAMGHLTVAQWAGLIDLLLLRGQLLGCIADYERAAALAEQLVCDALSNAIAFLARAKTRATFHRFMEALADLRTAEGYGPHSDRLQALIDAERAAIYQALGRYEEALALRQRAASCQPDFATVAALAGLQAERGEVDEAERLFSAGRQRYQGVSPFPLALLDFQRGVMWLEAGDFSKASAWFTSALRRLPAYVPAQGHLAEVDAAQGEWAMAITRLRPLPTVADDPEYAALLAGLLGKSGQGEEAQQWRCKAATRYDELVLRHPAAFADHAAEFWLTVGDDVPRAAHLAAENLAIRQTPRAYALRRRAEQARVSQLPNHPITGSIG